MPAQQIETSTMVLPRIGAAIAGAALVFPALALPLALGCLIGLGTLALRESRADDVVPETPPVARRSRTRRRNGRDREREEAGLTEDSFPASDPPSWTPVTGTRTRH